MKFLIADKMHESLLPALANLNIGYDYLPDVPKEQIKEIIGAYEGVILRSKIFVDEKLLSSATGLKVICRAGAGIDNLDVEAIEAKGIHIINAPEGNRDAVAEHCVALLLNLFNKINQADRQVRNNVWDREGNRGVELKGMTVGIIGFGNMGSAFAERLTGFSCRVIAYDKYKSGFGSSAVEEVSLDAIIEQSDVLSLHIPLTADTRFWINDAFIERLQRPVYLINTSRGEIISFKTLVNGLKTSKIVGVALDVLENEKLDQLTDEQRVCFDQLKRSERVIFTPHVAGWTVESYMRINEVIIQKLEDWLTNYIT